MYVRHVWKEAAIVAVLAVSVSFGVKELQSAEPTPPNPDQGAQVLTRGPVHEGFAEAVTFDPKPGVVAPKAPPEAIEELPPDERPEGDNVAWIPGYWAWDDERNDFLWVSGVWRALPPNRQWVPGYWAQSAEGYQWTSGYWADAKTSEVEYLPQPPVTVESGPNIAAPSPDVTWLPGCWVWRGGRYLWRPGYWAPMQPDWIWVPAHYVWTPHGWVFVGGYWDYAVARRGVLFAPVYFTAGVYARPGFCYAPSMVIDMGVFSTHLFLRPHYHHYYFGDYYAPHYVSAGYHPWFSITVGRIGYDPFYAHDCWEHRHDREWEYRQRMAYVERRDHVDLRPPHTFAAQRALDSHTISGTGKYHMVATSFDEMRKGKPGAMRFQAVEAAEKRDFTEHAHQMQQFRHERQTLEARTAGINADSRMKDLTVGKDLTPNKNFTVGKDSARLKDFTPGKDSSRAKDFARNRELTRSEFARTKEFAPSKLKLSESPIAAKTGPELGKDTVIRNTVIKDPVTKNSVIKDQFNKDQVIKDRGLKDSVTKMRDLPKADAAKTELNSRANRWRGSSGDRATDRMQFNPLRSRLPDASKVDQPAATLKSADTGAAATTGPANAMMKLDRTLPAARIERTLPATKLDRTLPVAQLDHTLPAAQLDRTLPTTKLDRTLPATRLDRTLPTTNMQRFTLPPKVEKAVTTTPVQPRFDRPMTRSRGFAPGGSSSSGRDRRKDKDKD